jgi:hypothetical protein
MTEQFYNWRQTIFLVARSVSDRILGVFSPGPLAQWHRLGRMCWCHWGRMDAESLPGVAAQNGSMLVTYDDWSQVMFDRVLCIWSKFAAAIY